MQKHPQVNCDSWANSKDNSFTQATVNLWVRQEWHEKVDRPHPCVLGLGPENIDKLFLLHLAKDCTWYLKQSDSYT